MIGRLDDIAFKSLQSLASRKYLLGVVLGWVLVVYLVVSPTPSASPPAAAAPAGPARAPSSTLAAPGLGLAALPTGAPVPTTAPSFGSFPSLSFNPGAPPAQAAALECPYPVPQSQTTPFNPGIFLSFEGPLVEMSGPFAAYDIPTLGAIAPLVPMATPLVYLSEPVMNALTPNLSTAVTDYLTIIDAAGLDSPQEQKYADQFEPYWLQLLGSLTPVEAELASSTAGQCLVLFENELAVMDSELNLSLPNPPLVPPGIPPGSSAAALEAATAAESPGSLAQLTLSWSGGVPPDLSSTVSALAAKGHPVALDLVDVPPAGQHMGGTGFSDFVAEAVHDSAGASAFEVDVPSAEPSAGAPMADLVHGLASADLARSPGQVIGLCVPAAATASGARAFWSAFAGAVQGWQANMVDFVAADLTPAAQSTPAADQAEAAAVARGVEEAFATWGGVPADVPLFGTVAPAGAGPWTVAEVQEQIAGYLGALHGLRVSVLGIGS